MNAAQRANSQATVALARRLDKHFMTEPEEVRDKKDKVVKDPDTGKIMMIPALPKFKQTERKEKGGAKLGTIDKLEELLAAEPFGEESTLEVDGLKIHIVVVERHTQRQKVSTTHLGLPLRWGADVTFEKGTTRWMFDGGEWKLLKGKAAPLKAKKMPDAPHRDTSDIDALEKGLVA